jgi:PBP1b-binding outer membrane lipoprotein LpoB
MKTIVFLLTAVLLFTGCAGFEKATYKSVYGFAKSEGK